MKKYTISDGTLVLQMEDAGGGWYTITSPLEPGLVTEARTIKDAFKMAYDARALLVEARRDLNRWNRTAKPKRKKTG